MSGIRQHRYTAPPGATTMFLVRHGESEAFDPQHPFAVTADGQGDPSLHEHGVDQARLLGERLAAEHAIEPFAALYVTSLRRTAETAAPFAALTGLECRQQHDLREVHLGDWEPGLLRVKAEERDPTVLEVFTTRRWDVIPGAEDHDEFGNRLHRALGSIAADHPDERVVVVVHGAVIGRVLGDAAGTDTMTFAAADNASISELIWTESRRHIRRFNDTSHLPRELG